MNINKEHAYRELNISKFHYRSLKYFLLSPLLSGRFLFFTGKQKYFVLMRWEINFSGGVISATKKGSLFNQEEAVNVKEWIRGNI